MGTVSFKRATRKQARLRLALIGPSGSGKTYTALSLACALSERVAVIDTERGSASKYAGRFEFDVLELDTFSPATYVEAIRAAEAAGYEVVVIDSLSHAWMGRGGALEQVDNASRKSESRNSYFAWRDVTPQHNALIDAMIGSRCHVIATMRAKTDYVIEKNAHGKDVPRKVGLAPIQRDGMEFEFDVVGDMDADNTLVITKSRCEALSGAVISRPGRELAETLIAWLSDGEAQPLPSLPQAQTPPQPAQTDTHPHLRAVMREFPALSAAQAARVIERCGPEYSEAETVDYARAFSAAMRAKSESPSVDAAEAVEGEMSIELADHWRTKADAPEFSSLTGAQLENVAEDPKSSPLTKQAARMVLAANAAAAQDNLP